ncbi:hypothetical protein [Acidithrix sp. C25]|uniref:hypothetical protein n=1 Tax=Acidithrix sp. C25 TaxID=1671482 RepID=UPI00191BBF05|nr:hypothetical protein [Acidithrix sp. C25]CAG4931771.1 unnamed protein product [Acidithrix sp. C25]
MTSPNRSVRADTKNMVEGTKSHFQNESIRGASAPRGKLMSAPKWWSATRSADCGNDPDAGWVCETDTNISWHESAKLVELTDDAILAPLEAQFGQVRSRQRVRELAEVFTHQREVDAMLDMIPDAFTELDVTFLEPTCGSGNFLIEILRRKLQIVKKAECVSQEHYEHRLLRALASIYGVDISIDNVTEARARMAHTVLSHYQSDANTIEPTTGFLNAAAVILGDNIVLGDLINNADEIELCEWRPFPAGRFQRIWSCALVPEYSRNLFWQERVQDVEPIHYSELVAAATPPKTKSRTRTKK